MTLSLAWGIIDEYQRQGFTLTLRQLYYQFVARDLIPNKQKERQQELLPCLQYCEGNWLRNCSISLSIASTCGS